MTDNHNNQPMRGQQLNQNIDTISSEEQLSPDYFLLLLLQIREMHDDEQKLNYANLLLQHIMQMYEKNIELKINESICSEILSHIGEGITDVQKALLRIVGVIAQIGSRETGYNEQNKFFYLFNSCGLIFKVLQIFNRELEINTHRFRKNKYSDFSIQLSQTIAFIYKNNIIENETIIKIKKIFDNQLIILTEQLKDYEKLSKKKEDQLEGLQQHMINEIESGVNILKGIQGLITIDANKSLFQTNVEFLQIISPLFHLNCPNQLKCQNHITIPVSIEIQELQGSTLVVIGQMIKNEQKLIIYMLKNHAAYEHIKKIIVSTQQDLSYQKKNAKQFQLPNSHSLSLIEGALDILQQLVKLKRPLISISDKHPLLIQTLIDLMSLKRASNICVNQIPHQQQIRINSNICLSWILNYSIKERRSQMINEYKIAQTEVEQLSNGGGNESENQTQIMYSLVNLRNIFLLLYQDQEQNTSYKRVYIAAFEQIESEGGNEEIQSYLFPSREMISVEIKKNVIILQKQMNNLKKHPSNVVPGEN